MGATTRIGWTDATWNPVTGCTKVSRGCDNCYAESLAERFRGKPGHFFENGFDVTLHPEMLDRPFRWEQPRKIFVPSMSDLFHSKVPDGYIAQVWNVMAQCPWHTFLILTKRPGRMRSWVRRWADTAGDSDVDGRHSLPPMPRGPEAVSATYTSGRARLFADMLDSMGTPPPGAAYPLYDWAEGPRWWPAVLPNVWLGVSVEDQDAADLRVPILLETPATVRWLSCEPLLNRITLGSAALRPFERQQGGFWEYGHGEDLHGNGKVWVPAPAAQVDWVVVGGESGPGARPMDPAWARSLRDECAAARVSFYFKQTGSVLARELGIPGKGEDWDRLPAEFQIRDYPAVPR